MQPSEDLVCFVDHREIEWRGAPERRRASLAAGEFPADQVNSGRKEIRLILSRLNAKEVQKLVLPLPDERLRHDQKDALRALRAALCDNQTGFYRLSQTNLVREDATAFTQTAKGKNYSVNLVRVGINSRLPLSRGIALSLIRPTHPD